MKKPNVTLEELSVNTAEPNLPDNKVPVANSDIPYRLQKKTTTLCLRQTIHLRNFSPTSQNPIVKH